MYVRTYVYQACFWCFLQTRFVSVCLFMSMCAYMCVHVRSLSQNSIMHVFVCVCHGQSGIYHDSV
jgi:hypothetical protein